MIVLETPRLILRLLSLDDIDAVAALYADPIVMAPKGGIRPRGYAEHVLQESQKEYVQPGFSYYAVIYRENQALIGLCGLLDQEVEGKSEVEIAYMFAKEYWNQGLATEAAIACKNYGKEHLGINRFVSLIAPANIPSQRVAIKNGMSYERDFIDIKGRSMRIYAVNMQ